MPIGPNCHYLTSDNSQLQKACDYIVAKLKQAKKVVTLPAIKLDRFGLTDKVIKLIEKLNIPFAIIPHDKSVISEHHKIYVGFYTGELSDPKTAETIEAAVIVINLDDAL
ncbi:MAG: hypothetical protein AB8U93_05470 [Francisella endosymbiont of Hyalomma scupense]